jgi:CRISPR-associated protein Cas5d
VAFRLAVSGPQACFPRVECTRDLITYDVITPMAARAIFEAVHWTPAIRWEIDEIRMLRSQHFEWISLADQPAHSTSSPPEASDVELTTLRRAHVLVDVCYQIVAHFEMTSKAGLADSPAQHSAMFRRRLKRGQYHRQPFLGLRVFPAVLAEVDRGDLLTLTGKDGGTIDLGWMLYDTYVEGHSTPTFFRPTMIDGVIDLRRRESLILAG